MSVTDVTDDHPESPATTGTVAVGGSATGAVETAGDHDWFEVALEAGKTYRVDLEGADTDAGTLSDPRLHGVYDADEDRVYGLTILDNGGVGRNSFLVFAPEVSGTYYIDAAAARGATGTYRVSVRELADDHPADTGTTGTVAVGGSATGEVEFAYDMDWFAVVLEAGTVYRVDLEGADTDAGTLGNPYLRGVYDAAGRLVSGTHIDDGGTGGNSRLFFEPEVSGTYYLVAGTMWSETGTYRVSVTEEVEDDHPASTATTGAVAVGGSARGEIETAGDRDWFAVTLEAGTVYRIDLEGADTDAGTLSDPWLRGVFLGVDDALVFLLAGTDDDDDGAGRNSRLVYEPESAGTYYIAAGANGGATGTYRLSVTEHHGPREDDHPADPTTTGTVAVGGTATGEIETAGDRDWFAVTLDWGKTYRIDLEGSDTSAGTLRDPHLRGVYDADGRAHLSTTNDDSGTGRNSRLVIETQTEPARPVEGETTYYISAGANDGAMGTYRLSVTQLVDHAADTSTAGTVAVGGSTIGEIEVVYDRDWFAVTLEAGKTYRIDLEGMDTDAGTLSDPHLRGVYDADGNWIPGTADDDAGIGSNSLVFFAPEATGTYYISAASDLSWPSASSAEGSYRLSVTDVTDDHPAGSVATTKVVAVGGSATGELETPDSREWFAATLEAGMRYRIDLEGRDTSAGTLWNPNLHGVYDATGERIPNTRDNDGGTGRNARIFFEPEASGTYYIAAGTNYVEAGIWPSTVGTFRVSVTLTDDDYPSGIGTRGVVAVGAAATGNIGYAGDRDWFAVTLDERGRYRVDLEGSDTDAGTLGDPYLHGVYGARGGRIGRIEPDDDGGSGRNSRLHFETATAGTWYIAAGADGSDTGSYRVSVTDVTDDILASTATSGVVEVGASATGEIERLHDQDWFAVTLESGRIYRIDLEGHETDAGPLWDPSLDGVHDAAGNLIAGTADRNAVAWNDRLYFEPESTGTYYIAAGSGGIGLGTYRLSVTAIVDDHPADTGTTGTVAAGRSATGEVESPGDRDWFAVTLEAGMRYRIDLEGQETDAGTLRDPYLRGLYDASGSLIGGTINDDGGVGWNSRVFFEPESAGTYFVAAGGHRQGMGTYRVSVTELDDDHPASAATTGTVAVDGSATGEIDYAGDRDWFAVAVEAGVGYRIDLEGQETGAGTLSDPYLRGVYDASGSLVAGTADNNGGAGRNSRLYFEPESAGTYYIAAGAYGSEAGTYRVSVTELDNDHPASAATTGAVAVDGSATGEIDYAGDRDWFAVTLEAGKTYRIDLEGSHTSAGTLGDPFLRGLHDAAGSPVAGTADNNGGAGLNSRVYFEPESAGTYYIAAGSEGIGVGAYRLSVTEIDDDHPADTGTTGTVAVGGSATGQVEAPGDRDWFAVALEAGVRYRIDLEGQETGAGTLSDPYLRGVYDASGSLIAGTADNDDGAGLNSRAYFEPETAGTYFVAAGGHGKGMGTYRVSVALFDDHPASAATTGTVAVDGSATGVIEEPGDRDWLAVALETGKIYRIDLEGSHTSAGTLSDPYLRGVYDASGSLIAGTADNNDGAGRNSRLFFEPGSAGTYYIGAGAGGRNTGTYRVSVTEFDDDHPADTGTTATVAVDGSATGDIETPGDRDWFEVTLQAEVRYRIDLEGHWTNAGTLWDPYLRGIHDASGSLIAGTTEDDGGRIGNSRVYFEPETAGTYYIAAGGHRRVNYINTDGNDYPIGTFTTGTYRVSVAQIDDHPASAATTGTVAVGGSATGGIQYTYDVDWFAVTLEAGKIYRIDLQGADTSAGTLRDPYLRGVYDAAGSLIAGTADNNGGAGRNSRVFFEPEDDGTYYIAASGASSWWWGTYRMSVTQIDDHPAHTGTTGTVAVDGSATGEIDYQSDRDWFAVTLEAGRTYRIDLEGKWTDAGTLGDPYLRGVHGADGTLIAGTAVDGGGTSLNSRLFFEPESAGTYYIAAGGEGSDTGTYRVSVTDITAEDDHPAGTGTTGTVAVGGTATGSIDYAKDHDWFAVTLAAGTVYRIDLEGSNTGAGTLLDPYLRGIHDAGGNLIAGTADDDGGTGWNSRLTFEPETTGTYYVAAGAAGTWTGTYELSVEEVL